MLVEEITKSITKQLKRLSKFGFDVKITNESIVFLLNDEILLKYDDIISDQIATITYISLLDVILALLNKGFILGSSIDETKEAVFWILVTRLQQNNIKGIVFNKEASVIKVLREKGYEIQKLPGREFTYVAYVSKEREQVIDKLLFKTSIPETKVKQIAQLIHMNCKKYLEEIDYKVSKYVLFRGIQRKTSSLLVKVKSRIQDRKPLETSKYLHRLFNEEFKKQFGWPVRNGVFVTGSSTRAEYYSKNPYIHVFFPIGDYKYVWSPHVPDLYTAISHIEEIETFSAREEDRDLFTRKEIEDFVSQYYNTNLKRAIKSGNEISFNVKEYYLLRYDHEGLDILKQIENLLKSGEIL